MKITVVTVVICLSALAQLAHTATAAVKILVVDTFGSPTPFRIVEFTDESGRNFAGQFVESTAAGLPLGKYRLHAESQKIGPIRRELIVSHQDSFIVVAGTTFYVDYLPGKAPVLTGSIRSLSRPLERPIWVKLYGIYLDGSVTVEVDQNLEFRVPNPNLGSYLISVVSKSGVLMTGQVDVRKPDAKLVLDVASGSILFEP